MKKKYIAILISLICVAGIFYIGFNIYTIISTKKQSQDLLKQAYEVIEKPITNEQNNKIIENNETIQNNIIDDKIINKTTIQNNDMLETVSDNGIIGVLLIPKLNIEAPVKEGTSLKIMKTSVGHFTESDYWNGNVSLASHNSGTSAHYFEKINNLNSNDEIIYKTKLGTKKYKVKSIEKINSTDWSKIVKNSGINKEFRNGENTITLVTCINRQPNYRLCIRGVEVKD